MRLDKIIDKELRALFKYSKSTNISAADLKRVDVLNLDNTPISTLQDLANMSNLKALNISGTNIKDLSPLKYTSIESLCMYNIKIEDLSVLSELTNLKELYIVQPLSEQDKRIISTLVNLELLVVNSNNENLVYLYHLKKLKKLSILDKYIDLNGIQHLPNLEILNIESTKIDNIKYLSNLTNIKEIISLQISKENKKEIISYGHKLYLTENEDSFYPGYVSELLPFKLDGGLKRDAGDIFRALGIISIIVFVLFSIVGGINNGIDGILQALAYSSIFVTLMLVFSTWYYLLGFTIEIDGEKLILKRTYYKEPKEIDFKSIKKATFFDKNMQISKLILDTDKGKIRLSFSVFANMKLIKFLLAEFKERNIEVIKK